MADVPSNALLLNRRRRAMIACTNCRKRKIKCVTSEEPPRRPCARCTKRNLGCEYVAVEEDLPTADSPVTPTYPPPNNPSVPYPNHGVPPSGGYYPPPNNQYGGGVWDPAQPQRHPGYPTSPQNPVPGYGQSPTYGPGPYASPPGYPSVPYGYPQTQYAPLANQWPQQAMQQQQPRCTCGRCSVCRQRT
ncbi:hypothetical protein B0H11DRAFT_137463 [Mycena galericulata]|nr:hypothetical protein B0H11DRAFT_137463 [Mycena galericulata]